MKRILLHSTFGLLTALGLMAIPADAKAQYASPGGGISFATPNLGISLGFGQTPVYRPYPVPAPYYPVYSPGYPVYAPRPYGPPAPVYGHYHGYYGHGPVHTPYYGHSYGHSYGHRY